MAARDSQILCVDSCVRPDTELFSFWAPRRRSGRRRTTWPSLRSTQRLCDVHSPPASARVVFLQGGTVRSATLAESFASHVGRLQADIIEKEKNRQWKARARRRHASAVRAPLISAFLDDRPAAPLRPTPLAGHGRARAGSSFCVCGWRLGCFSGGPGSSRAHTSDGAPGASLLFGLFPQGLELIPSENFTAAAVMEAVGSVMARLPVRCALSLSSLTGTREVEELRCQRASLPHPGTRPPDPLASADEQVL